MLVAAAERGDVEAVRRALREGVNPNERVDGSPPLEWACRHENVEMAKVLIAARADIEFEVAKGVPVGCVVVKLSGLQMCCALGSLKMAKLLVEAAADLNHTDVLGCTALLFGL